MFKKSVYSKQKILLYFDENFPRELIARFKNNKYWKKKCRVYSVFDYGNQNKDDNFQLSFCKKRKFALVTLDKGFMDNKKYQIDKIPGIIRIVAGKSDTARIKNCLENFIIFFSSYFHFSRWFIGDSKFQVSFNHIIMQGRDARSRKIKTMEIGPKTTNIDIAREFNWPIK